MSAPPGPPPTTRWTITRAARAVHDAVLAPAGFKRRGNRSMMDDFLHREVFFYSARFMDTDERTLQVNFHLEWNGLPPDVPTHPVGGSLERTYLQPVEPDGAIDPELIATVGGPVLDYLMRPTTPSAFVDELLAFRETRRRAGPLMLIYGELSHWGAAAWGALMLNDATRCRAAIAMVDAAVRRNPAHHVLVDLRDEMRRVEAEWRARYGSALPT